MRNNILKKLGILLTAGAVMVSSFSLPSLAAADTGETAVPAGISSVRAVAFPGAEGGGMYTSGARGALDNDKKIEVYHVTSLEDSGPGTFRDAVSQGNRIVVFDVSGYIDLDSNVNISHDNTTVLGQTAPGDGITLRSNNVKIGGNNVIVRFLKFRVGAHDANGRDTRAQDGMEITDNSTNVIVDHCSVSWGTDENLSAYAVKDVTIQNCIISEALNQSVHDKGEHSYAAIWGGVNLSVHHNIIASHKSRNPKIGTSETVAMTAGYTDDQTLVDIKNNVFYNWGDKAGYGAENGAKTYIQNNIYKPGPATPAGKRSRIFELSSGNKYKTDYIGSVYASGNKIAVDEGDSDYANAQKVNADNWQDDLNTGVYVPSGIDATADKTNMKIEAPDAVYQAYEAEYPITMTGADEAYESVLKNAGAIFPKRDKVDERIVSEVSTRTAPTGSKGSTGLLDDPVDGIPEGSEAEYDGRGYPIIQSEARAADYDTDRDGIPDAWEDKMGLNKENPNDSTYIGPNGYTYLEIFADEGISYQPGDITLSVEDHDADFSAVVTSPSGEAADIYVDGVLAGTAEFEVTAPKGSTVVTAGYSRDGALAEMKWAIQESEGAPAYPELTEQADSVKHFVWDSLEGMQPVGSTGGGVSVRIPYGSPGVHTVTAVGRDSGSCSNMDYAVCAKPASAPVAVDGDFNLVLTLNKIPDNVKNASYCASLAYDGGKIDLCSGTDDSYNTVVRSGETVLPLDGAKYLRASREGNTLKTYMSSSLLNWTEIASYEISGTGVTVNESDAAPNGAKYATNVVSRLITEKSAPKLSINNIEQNQRIGFNQDIEVKITPDGAAVQEIDVLFGGVIISALEVDIDKPQTVSIPVSFDNVAAGTLEIACVDRNLCVGRDSRDITVSADPNPWKLMDIGMSADVAKTYVQVTNDFTYKMFCPAGGSIGGTSDKFGYMYQQFEGDNRMYFRMRPQSSSQYGVVLRSDLDPDGIAYYFGCDGNHVYNLRARTSKGGEMQLIENPIDGGADKRFLIVEKRGGKFNVYETNDSSPMYTQEKLLCSIDCSLLGDKYYMGIGITGENPGDFGDIGWTGIESLSDEDGAEKITWNFNNGLDWRWQLQEANVLTPSWTDEEVAGNATGKMKISTTGDYDERYVLHEYTPGSVPMVVSAGADVLLSGDEAGINVYINDGSSDRAFKVSFTEGGTIAIADTDTGAAYDPQKWYHVAYTIDEGYDNSKAAVRVTDAMGNTVAENGSVPLTAFRSQIDSKKVAISNGIFFEAVGGKTANYYIDNVSVAQKESTSKPAKTTSWYSFEDVSAISGAFTVDGTKTLGGEQLSGEQISIAAGAQLKTGNKSVGGKTFTNRIRIKGNNGKITVPVKKGSVITVYAASAKSTSARPLIINGQTTQIMGACATTYEYTGEAGTIAVSGGDNIEIYGICVETVNAE